MSLDIPYKFRDFCQDDYADYISCARVRPNVIENKISYALPFSDYFTSCKLFRKQWQKCEEYREKEVFEELKKIFDRQRDIV